MGSCLRNRPSRVAKAQEGHLYREDLEKSLGFRLGGTPTSSPGLRGKMFQVRVQGALKEKQAAREQDTVWEIARWCVLER